MARVAILSGLLLFFCASNIYSSHIIGGNIGLVALDKVPGRYTLSLTLYQDSNGDFRQIQAGFRIFRKRDNKEMAEFYANITDEKTQIFTNESCAKLRNLEFTVITF